MEMRQERELEVYRLLDSLGIAWERWDHPPVATIEDCEEIGNKWACPCAKSFLCNRTHTEFYLLMLGGEKTFRTKKYPNKFPRPDFPLQRQSIWKSIFISVRERSASWDS